MFYCPYCGTELMMDESYCLTCGKKMTKQIKQRIKLNRTFNRYLLIPICTLVLCLLLLSSYIFFKNNQLDRASQSYQAGEEYLGERSFESAIGSFEDALSNQPGFSQAEIALNFARTALNIQLEIDGIPTLLQHEHYDKALQLIDRHDKQLSHYQGETVNDIIAELTDLREEIQIAEIQSKLSKDHSIEDLKVLLWDIDAINNEAAEEITQRIRQEIADYSFSLASDKLNKHHFNDALFIVEDGLKFSPYSEKLINLQQTIEKEKVAFETAQQERIEQAIDLAEEEESFNKNKAVQVKTAKLSKDDQNRLVVRGEIKSQATVPIQSVFVEYKIVTDDGSVIETNRVFAFPERLYPKDVGTFEFTHYEIDGNRKDLAVEIDKITWYLD